MEKYRVFSRQGSHGYFDTFAEAKETADKCAENSPNDEIAIFEKVATVKAVISPPTLTDCRSRQSLAERLNYPA